ncbi:hypothetical protein pdam_00018583, partial [Pocillopora damicornis]
MSSIQQEQYVLTTVKEMKLSLVKMLNKRNQTQHMRRKQKSLTLTPEEKKNEVNESGESREKRLAQQRLTREKKRANESSESRKKGVGKPNLSIKDKKLQMNQNVETVKPTADKAGARTAIGAHAAEMETTPFRQISTPNRKPFSSPCWTPATPEATFRQIPETEIL